VASIAAMCHAAGVPVLVDGAHAPGQLDLDVAATGADWYTGNCHKWLCAPKGAAFLWASPDRQGDLHPPVISHGLGKGFLAEFDWTGTRDPTAALTVPDAIEFHQQLGGSAMRARNIALAAAATGLLARRLNSEAGATGEMAGAMGVVRLPVPAEDRVAAMLRDRLLAEGTDAPVFVLDGAVWLRLSAFAYNAPEDYGRLANLVVQVLRDAEHTDLPGR
jgi:isopenicillin-N epimerase